MWCWPRPIPANPYGTAAPLAGARRRARRAGPPDRRARRWCWWTARSRRFSRVARGRPGSGCPRPSRTAAGWRGRWPRPWARSPRAACSTGAEGMLLEEVERRARGGEPAGAPSLRGRLHSLLARLPPPAGRARRAPCPMPEGDTLFRAARTLHQALRREAGGALRDGPGAAVAGRRGRAHRRAQRGARCAAWGSTSWSVLRRPGPPYPPADERELARVPARASAGSARARRCGSSWRRPTSRRWPSTCRWPSSGPGGRWRAIRRWPALGPGPAGPRISTRSEAVRRLRARGRWASARRCWISGRWPGWATSSRARCASPSGCTRSPRCRRSRTRSCSGSSGRRGACWG